MTVHGQLMDVDGDVFDGFHNLTGILVEYGQVAHLVAGINLIAVGCETEGHDVRPFVDVGAVWLEPLYPVLAVFFGHGSVGCQLSGNGHVIVEIAPTQVSYQQSSSGVYGQGRGVY